eukprot:COSAG02_NODE_1491_length_12358_cov_52.348014_3_plen_114_part_00
MLRKFSCEIVDASLRLMLTKHQNDGNILAQHGTELCVVRTFGGVDFFAFLRKLSDLLRKNFSATNVTLVVPGRANTQPHHAACVNRRARGPHLRGWHRHRYCTHTQRARTSAG